MKAEFRHIAIVSEHAQQACKFYETLFGVHMEEGRGNFTDGYVGFNMLTRRNGNTAGANHYGFAIDSVDEVKERLRELYPEVGIVKRPARGFAGWGTHDPEGNAFDLSPADMARRGTYVSMATNTPHERHISHFQINAIDPERVGKFYKDVFDLTELTKHSGDPRVYLSDGFVTFIVAPWKLSNFTGGIDYKPTIDHLGWRVESLSRFMEDVERITKEQPELKPKPFSTEGELRRELLAQCSHGSYQMADSEGVLIDVSE